ncbi:MAG: hypothetical protein AAF351_12990, partial [Pseudomonadota bacterium]
AHTDEEDAGFVSVSHYAGGYTNDYRTARQPLLKRACPTSSNSFLVDAFRPIDNPIVVSPK